MKNQISNIAKQVQTKNQLLYFVKVSVIDLMEAIAKIDLFSSRFTKKTCHRKSMSEQLTRYSFIDYDFLRTAPQGPARKIDVSVTKNSTPKVSVQKVSVTKVSTPKVSVTKVSTPKVTTPKGSVTKGSTPKISVPKISVTKVSTPKISVTKGSALKVSVTKINTLKVNAWSYITPIYYHFNILISNIAKQVR